MITGLVDIVIVLVLGYALWVARNWVVANMEYKQARRLEIKRRLQIDAQNEATLDQKLKLTEDPKERVEIMMEGMRQRNRRELNYVLADILERENNRIVG